jgi:cytochrome c-type biogenesis protein
MASQLVLAFAAGLLSFITPCVLPLVPGYLSVAAGVDAGRSEADGAPRMLRGAVPFVLGFVVVFALAGAVAGLAGSATASYRPVVAKVGGIVIVAMGFALLGALPGPGLARVVAAAPGRRARRSPVLLGAAFALCSAPCVGPMLASILVLAADTETAAEGTALLLVYAAGLAVPFLLVAATLGRALARLRPLRDLAPALRAVSGGVLVATGLLLFFDRLWWVNLYVNRMLRAVGLDGIPTV